MGPTFNLGTKPDSLGSLWKGNQKPKMWIAVRLEASSFQNSQGYSLSRHCESLSDLQEEVERLKRDLDAVVTEARSMFGSGGG